MQLVQRGASTARAFAPTAHRPPPPSNPMQLHDTFAYGMVGVAGVRLMSAKTFHKHKGVLLPLLRERADPPPRRMRAGQESRDAWHANLRQLLERTGGTVVRGFKLFKIRIDPAHWKVPGWLATTHVVVATVSPSGTIVYTDPNAQLDGSDEYIFVPTARAHRELTDAQLLSGEWHVGSVVGGPASFCERFVAHERLQGRAHSVVAASVAQLVSKPRVIVRLPPHFAEWFRVNEMQSSLHEVAELMGAPTFPCDEAAQADAEIDALEAYVAVTGNPEACVDGVRGLKLELKCREQLLSGKLSIAEARRHFFSYFDGVYSTVRQRQTRRFAEWCAACKQVPPGGL